MRLEITDDDLLHPQKHRLIRAAAFFLLQSIGDIPEETVVPEGTTPIVPSVASVAMATDASNAGASAAGTTTTNPVPPPPTGSEPASSLPPPPPRPIIGKGHDPNVGGGGESGPHVDNGGDDDDDEGDAGNVPPPPNVATAGASAAPSSVVTAAGAPGVVSAEVDSAGMPYDARIHQKAKGKKKNGEWKLIKGIDEAIVQAVTAELAARKATGYNPAQDNAQQVNAASGASAGSLPSPPSVGNSVPLPPSANAAAASGVPAPNAVGSSVPVPPAPAPGSVGASDTTPYRKLIDKITDLTKANKITAAKVMELCQSHGAPSLMALKGMQDNKSVSDPALTVCQAVDRDIDAAALGLL